MRESSGWVEVHPRYRERLAELGLTTAESLLELPGEIVSGHPDRHVRRVELPGWATALYLKRQHRVGWRERLRQWLAGFGWSSRCQREAKLLRELEAAGFACPQWIANGEDGQGRAFLLVEELTGSVELRRFLSDTPLSLDDRTRLAERLGQAIAELHAAGFDAPDLAAKHVFVNPDTFAVTLIDWQSARRKSRMRRDATTALRSEDSASRLIVRALAALDASLADQFADPRERLRFLWAYLRVSRSSGLVAPRFSAFARGIGRLSERARSRRSIRDQREVAAPEQRLVWLAGEAVCAIPDIAATWPKPAIAPPFYDDGEIMLASSEPPSRITLPDGRLAELIHGQSFAPLARLRAALRGRPWRSPGVTVGRVLFHLQRYGIPAPQLFAFGQRDTAWFALYEPPIGQPLADWLASSTDQSLRLEVLDQVGRLLRQLHDSGCRYLGSGPLFWVAREPEGRVAIGGATAVRIAKRVPDRTRRADREAILASLPGITPAERESLERGTEVGRP